MVGGTGLFRTGVRRTLCRIAPDSEVITSYLLLVLIVIGSLVDLFGRIQNDRVAHLAPVRILLSEGNDFTVERQINSLSFVSKVHS